MSKTFSEVIQSRMCDNGFVKGNRFDYTGLAKRAGIKRSTFYNRLNDDNWSREDLMALHKIMRFSHEDMEIYLGKELRN